MGRPAIKGAGVDDIHGGLFGRFVDGYVTYIIAVSGEQGERTVARLELEGRSQPRIDRRDDPAGKHSDWNGLQHFHRRSLLASCVSKKLYVISISPVRAESSEVRNPSPQLSHAGFRYDI